MKPAILFENAKVIVVDKPSGWLSVPSRQGANDPRPCVGTTLTQQLHMQLWPVHRLDVEVSGILMFAKDALTHRGLNNAFEKRLVQKTYHALTTANPNLHVETKLEPWRSKIVRGKKRSFHAEHGKTAETRATYIGPCQLGDRPQAYLWHLEPVTGRPHQLRLELATREWPIWGDTLYGGVAWDRTGIALRAVAITAKNSHIFNELSLPVALRAPSLLEKLG